MSIEVDGPEIRRRRLAAGFSQAQLARMAGISKNTVGLIENGGQRTVNQNTWKGLVAVLGDGGGFDPHLTDAQLAYLASFTAWLRDPSAKNFLRRRVALDSICPGSDVLDRAA